MTTPLRFVPKGATKIADKQSDAIAYIYLRTNQPCAQVFYGKQTKPVWRYRFFNEKQRADRIAEAFKDRRDRQTRKDADRAKAVAFTNPYKIGDLFQWTWGYDQTNQNYFEVTQVKGKYVWVKELEQKYIETGFMSGKTVPLPGAYLKDATEKKCLAQDGRIRVQPWARGGCAYYVKPTMIAGVPVYQPSYTSSYA